MTKTSIIDKLRKEARFPFKRDQLMTLFLKGKLLKLNLILPSSLYPTVLVSEIIEAVRNRHENIGLILNLLEQNPFHNAAHWLLYSNFNLLINGTMHQQREVYAERLRKIAERTYLQLEVLPVLQRDFKVKDLAELSDKVRVWNRSLLITLARHPMRDQFLAMLGKSQDSNLLAVLDNLIVRETQRLCLPTPPNIEAGIFVVPAPSSIKTRQLATGIEVVSAVTDGHLSKLSEAGVLYCLGSYLEDGRLSKPLFPQIAELFLDKGLLDSESGLLHKADFENALQKLLLQSRGGLLAPAGLIAKSFLFVKSASFSKNLVQSIIDEATVVKIIEQIQKSGAEIKTPRFSWSAPIRVEDKDWCFDFINALGQVGLRTPEIVKLLRVNLANPNGGIRLAAATALSRLTTGEDAECLFEAFLKMRALHENETIELSEAKRPGQVGYYYEKLAHLRSRQSETMAALANALILVGDNKLALPLINALYDGESGKLSENYEMNRLAANVLAEIGGWEIIPVLRMISEKAGLKGQLNAAITKIKYSIRKIIADYKMEIEAAGKQEIPKAIQMRMSKIIQQEVKTPLSSQFAFETINELSVEPKDALAIITTSAHLAAKDREEYAANLAAIVDLISCIRSFKFKWDGKYEVCGLRDDLVFGALPLIARRARSAQEFQAALQAEKEAVHFARTIAQTLKDFHGYCSEDDIGFSGTYERNYAWPLQQPLLPQIKCLALDGDGTLWGGIVGEDGWDGIILDESYLNFQRQLLELKKKGVILTLTSRNNPEDVEAIFNRRPEMLLKREDFTVVKVNWRDKSGNIEEIARELDISTESVAFIDNSPVERRLVRAGLSQVFTPELPVPRDYAAFLTALAVDFLPTGETAEDGARADLYMTRAAAAKMIDAKGGREAGIRSLELRGEIATDPRDLVARIAQITQRTNQFNLTTHRYEKGEIEKFLNDPNYRIYTLRLDSKVGDYGVIGLVILRKNGETAWEIDTFCLSCRILPMQLEVEQALLAHIVAKLKQQGAKFLIGKYVPTQKNIIVRELFRRLGFDKVTEEENGTTTWQLDLTQRTITGTSLIKFV